MTLRTLKAEVAGAVKAVYPFVCCDIALNVEVELEIDLGVFMSSRRALSTFFDSVATLAIATLASDLLLLPGESSH